MKKIFIIVLFVAFSGYAQVGVGTSNPDASAQLDVVSTNKGVLIPRMSLTGTSDIITIANPKESLLVYNTATTSDVLPGFYFWNSLKWVSLSGGLTGTVAIGNGGTGATTTTEALTNLGAQSVANISTVLGATSTRYPAESAVKNYVDAESTRALGVEATLLTATINEAALARAAEIALQAAVDLKPSTADVTTAVATETTRAIGVEFFKATIDNLSAETTRATAAEIALQAAVDLKPSTADVTTAVAIETARAIGVEYLKATIVNLTAEKDRATNTEALKEDLGNKTIVIDGSSTVNDAQYPSALAVKTYVDAVPSFYSANGTLNGARIVAQNNNNLTFTTGSAQLVVNGTLKTNGAVLRNFVTTALSVYTIPDNANTVYFTGTSLAVFTLPTPSSANAGMEIRVINASSVAIQYAGSINGNSTNIAIQGGTVGYGFCDGTSWFLSSTSI